ncbi:MAG: hypothetical protein UU11_C0003G0020 [Parcubacteria group bacterium GW2011_GWF2_40_69]|nr:MAG: hypothetical protein UT68_C0006G0020 [Parcubacteria group bacterium GW2011_GWC2_40_10]KKR66173.1 MAG: hypothetical protein UU06_C0004G0005 [Parcubacteria group bacterium GW2011_GWB1_40_5]KKR69026.1 MAG: hypothetical protein UU11_C0003G0020 [Parcubacteria group bacterium GW2011_GWF2_40_69]KKR80172.1 MAG: hypothetical protein UU27_C0036G0008 [Parcubacteria group bacterium GW2011_GWD1_40_9]
MFSGQSGPLERGEVLSRKLPCELVEYAQKLRELDSHSSVGEIQLLLDESGMHLGYLKTLTCNPELVRVLENRLDRARYLQEERRRRNGLQEEVAR